MFWLDMIWTSSLLESFRRDRKFVSYASPILVAGIIVFALVVFCGIEFGGGRLWRRSREELPLLAPRDDQAMPGHATNDLSGIAVSTPPGESAPYGESARDDQQLCTICLDAPKDCFFDPCGHRCTCYSCGRRSVSLFESLGCRTWINQSLKGASLFVWVCDLSLSEDVDIKWRRQINAKFLGCAATVCLSRYVFKWCRWSYSCHRLDHIFHVTIWRLGVLDEEVLPNYLHSGHTGRLITRVFML